MLQFNDQYAEANFYFTMMSVAEYVKQFGYKEVLTEIESMIQSSKLNESNNT
jgi:hypothetical protein